MKVLLSLLLIGLLCLTLGEEADDQKNFNETCIKECEASEELKTRALNLDFKSSDEDLCYLKCLGRIFKTIENNKISIVNVAKLFSVHRAAPPVKFELVSDITVNDPYFMEIASAWIRINKHSFIKAIDSISNRDKDL